MTSCSTWEERGAPRPSVFARPLRKEIADADPGRGGGEGAHGVHGPQGLDRPVGPPTLRLGRAVRIAVDLQDAVHQVDDPVLGDARSRVKAALALAIQAESR